VISFAAGGKLRAEIYLDMASPPEGAKVLFDGLRSERAAEIEAAMPEEVAWERIDGKRASRIAVYASAPELSDKDASTKAVEWAADRLVRFMQFDADLRSRANELKGS